MPPVARSWNDYATRPFASLLDAPYWQAVLQYHLPEFFLEPFVRQGATAGCDLACGWGRVSLTLPTYDARTIHCCDSTPKNLRLLRRLAANEGISQHVIPHQCDVTRLPFGADTFDFYLAFDIFEHLSDTSLRQCLDEILRTARPGAVLYSETPMQSYCLAVTHVQNFTFRGFIDFVLGYRAHGKRYEVALFLGENAGPAAHQFAFRVK
jgi:ubiquinone/menaquinone biosynthesis C-methylase UbiE